MAKFNIRIYVFHRAYNTHLKTHGSGVGIPWDSNLKDGGRLLQLPDHFHNYHQGGPTVGVRAQEADQVLVVHLPLQLWGKVRKREIQSSGLPFLVVLALIVVEI
jgi:hypothetical protein